MNEISVVKGEGIAMERYQLENLYKLAGLDDFKIRDTHNLLECHGIRVEDIEGYSKLDEDNKTIFLKFIVNFYNMQGMMSRGALQPKGIYFVEDVEKVAEDPDDSECRVIAKTIITAIYEDGSREIIHNREHEEYKDLPIVDTHKSNYLRFEYVAKSHFTIEDKEGNEHTTVEYRDEWLHVIDGGEQWY